MAKLKLKPTSGYILVEPQEVKNKLPLEYTYPTHTMKNPNKQKLSLLAQMKLLTQALLNQLLVRLETPLFTKMGWQ